MHLAYEAALARVELCRVLRRDDPEWRRTLESACRISTRIGSVTLAHEAQTLLDEPSAPLRSV